MSPHFRITGFSEFSLRWNFWPSSTEKAVEDFCDASDGVAAKVTSTSLHGELLAKYTEGCWRLCCDASDGVPA